MALAEAAKVLIARHSQDLIAVRQIWFSALAISGLFIIAWLIFLPFWGSFATLLNKNNDLVATSVEAMKLLIIPYLLFVLNTVTDAIFYGVGKTQYQAYQAIITNGTVYVLAFIAYMTGIWTPTFVSIMLLFGAGILVDSIFTVYYARRVLYPTITPGPKVIKVPEPA